MRRTRALIAGFMVITRIPFGAEASPDYNPQPLSLEACIEKAMLLNQRLPASRFALAASEAQHRQALSAYWPTLSFRGAYELMDEPRSFIFPENTIALPTGTSIDLNVGGGVTVPLSSFEIPEQYVKLQDEESVYATVESRWLLWDGGMRKGMRAQTAAGVEAAQAEVKRTHLEITDSVTRMYYGAVVATQLHRLGQETLVRMETTLNLTQRMYEEGAGSVKKTDYLDNRMMVETFRSAVASLEKNEIMAQAALAYAMGLGWEDSVRPADRQIPFEPVSESLNALVDDAYVFSPDWAQLEAGMRAAEGALGEARSGHYPKLALTGNLHKWWNDYDYGYATEENKEGWTVSIGLELPLFQGFLTRNKVKETRARLEKIRAEEVLLQEGIGIKIRDIIMGLNAASKRYEATQDAMNTAIESRDLYTRAYQNDLVETSDVIRAQLMEAFMSAQHYMMRYNHAELRSQLNLVVGTEVLTVLAGE